MTTALTLEATGQVVAWGDEVENPAPADQIRHTNVTGTTVVDASKPKYTKVVASVFVAMDEAERKVVDDATPTGGPQSIIVLAEDAITSGSYQSIFAQPLQPRPVVAGWWKLEASFRMRGSTPQNWTANGPDGASLARLKVGNIELLWHNTTDIYNTYTGFISAELLEGAVPPIDFEVARPTGGGVTYERVELLLHKIDGHVHDVSV